MPIGRSQRRRVPVSALLLFLVGGVFAALMPHFAVATPPPTKIALVGGRIIPVRGPEIESGTVLIENGRITAVGETVELPFDAMEIDCTGKVLFPGMVDSFNWRGLDIRNEAIPNASVLDVYDAIDPSRLFFEETLRVGITAVHISHDHNTVIGSVIRVLRPIGRTPDEMTLRAPVSIQLALTPRQGSDRMRQLAELREAFLDLDDHLGQVAERRYEEEREKEGKKVDVPPAEARERGSALVRDIDLDEKYRNLYRLRQGKIGAWLYAGAATDVAPGIEIAKEQKLLERAVILIGSDAHRAVRELKEAGRPVVCPIDLVARSRDPLTGEIDETFIPKVLHDAGIEFTLRPNPDGSIAERYLTYQAARCVRAGIPRNVALRAITLHPARCLGLDAEIGSIEVGKRGDIVVLSGDPLDFTSWVEAVYIDGILAYDRERDPRLRELIGLLQSPAEEKPESPASPVETPADTTEPIGDPVPPVESGGGTGGGEGDGDGRDGGGHD